MNAVKSRVCPECGVEQPLTREYFYVGSKCHDGFRNPCKSCANKKIPHHPKFIDLYNKRCPSCGETFPRTEEYFYKNNYQTWDNLAGICKTCHNEKVKKWSEKNPDKVNGAKRKYAKKNRKKIQERNNETRRIRYATDPAFKMSTTLRNGLRLALNGRKKYKKTMDLLGCTIEFFISYIESQFTEGMSWDNHGFNGWHLDHIIPVGYFDLTKKEDQEKCFHYSNFMPLWAGDNFAKNSIYNGFLYRGGKVIKEKEYDKHREIQGVA